MSDEVKNPDQLRSINKQNKMNTQINPQRSTTFTEGAILVDCWGYEQTNIDFYCIVKRTNDFITLLPMTKKSEGAGTWATMNNVPGEIKWDAKPIRKKIKSYNGEESGFSLRNYTGGGWCRLWKGDSVTSTHYA